MGGDRWARYRWVETGGGVRWARDRWVETGGLDTGGGDGCETVSVTKGKQNRRPILVSTS